MKGLIQLGVEVEGLDELQAAAGRATDALEVPCFSRVVGTTDETFTVIGTVRGKPDEKWSVVVDAPDAAAAQERALAVEDRRVVVGVFRGDQAPEDIE